MNTSSRVSSLSCLLTVVVALFCLLLPGQSFAQPTIVSTVPANGAKGVAPSAKLIITFSEAMSTSATTAYLVDSTTLGILPSSLAWSGGNRVLTCTPTTALPANRTIWWTVNGQNPAGTPLSGITGGTFTTAADQLVLTNAAWSGGQFSFDVVAPAGQVTVLFSSTLASSQWQTLLTTTNGTGIVHVTDPQSLTNRSLFYRARSGP